jgi:UV DNA damage repair endonuclease
MDFCLKKINEGYCLGYNCFIFELIEDDFKLLDFTINDLSNPLSDYLKSHDVRIAFYIKSKKSITSDIKEEVIICIDELKKCIDFSKKFFQNPQECPTIIHIGGAKGDRRYTMEKFCNILEENFEKTDISRIAVINDEKPSLFSVKDLLPGVFYRLKTPIIFRSTSYPTNQGNLTLNESLFLSASTWERTINPIFIYLPSEFDEFQSDQSSPFDLQLDIIFDNRLPDPK